MESYNHFDVENFKNCIDLFFYPNPRIYLLTSVIHSCNFEFEIHSLSENPSKFKL